MSFDLSTQWDPIVIKSNILMNYDKEDAHNVESIIHIKISVPHFSLLSILSLPMSSISMHPIFISCPYRPLDF